MSLVRFRFWAQKTPEIFRSFFIPYRQKIVFAFLHIRCFYFYRSVFLLKFCKLFCIVVICLYYSELDLSKYFFECGLLCLYCLFVQNCHSNASGLFSDLVGLDKKMNDFIMHYGVCCILCLIGGLLVTVTYGSYFSKSSGVPFVGGFFIALGFLTTPHKWLALLCLVDPGWMNIVLFFRENKQYEQKKKEFQEIIEAGYMTNIPETGAAGTVGDVKLAKAENNAQDVGEGKVVNDMSKSGETKVEDTQEKNYPKLLVTIPEREETLEWSYILNQLYVLRVPRLFFCFCQDKRGKRYVLYDSPSGDDCIHAMAYELRSVTIKGLKDGKKNMTVILDVDD